MFVCKLVKKLRGQEENLVSFFHCETTSRTKESRLSLLRFDQSKDDQDGVRDFGKGSRQPILRLAASNIFSNIHFQCTPDWGKTGFKISP